MRRLRLIWAATAGVVVSLVTAPGAWALLPAVDLSTGAVTPSPADLQAVAGSDGSAAVAYTRAGRVLLALKDPGQPFDALSDLGTGANPKLASTPGGRMLLAWTTAAGTPALHLAIREQGATTITFLPDQDIAGLGALAVHGAPDGSLYIGSATATTLSLQRIPPGSSTPVAAFTTPLAGVREIALGSQTSTPDRPIAWVFATAASGATSTANVIRWTANAGASATTAIDSVTSTTSGAPPLVTSTTRSLRTPAVISGDEPSFTWQSNTSTTSIGNTTVSNQLKRADRSGIAFTTTVLESLSGIGFFGGVTQFGTRQAVDAAGGGILVWGSRTGIGGSDATVTAASRTPEGASGPSLTIPSGGLTGLAVATTGANSGALLAALDGRLRINRLTAAPGGAVTASASTEVTLPTGESPGLVAAAGTGAGDLALAWTSATVLNDVRVQVALDDVVPPTLEVQAPPTAVSSIAATTQAAADSINAGLRKRSYTATAADTWTPTTVSWDFGDGATATGASAEHTYATAGRKTVTVTATDRAGNRTTKVITDEVPQIGVTPTQPPQTTDLARLTGVSLAARAFRAARGKVGGGRGTTLRFTLSRAATVQLRTLRITRGFRTKGGACMARRPKGTSPKRCERQQAVGSATSLQAKGGQNAVPFAGRSGRRALPPGAYLLQVATTDDPRGGASLRFTIRR